MTSANLIASNGNLLKPTPVGDMPIPLQDSITVKLTTGRVVEMVVGEISMLYEMGEIPDELTSIAARELFPPSNDGDREREKRVTERFRLAKWLAARVLRNPVVVDKPSGANEIAITYLYHDEIWEIYTLANSPARAMNNFRRQQAQHVVDLSRQREMGSEAESGFEGSAADE